jgi:thiamine-phosphate pyrophosphorylase
MQSFKEVSAPQLYLIAPHLNVTSDEDFAHTRDLLMKACKGGVAAVLLRFHKGQLPVPEQKPALKSLINDIQATGAAVLIETSRSSDHINDVLRLIHHLNADGVHLSYDIINGVTVETWRKACGKNLILGVSHLKARHDAMEAGEAGADYLMFGEHDPYEHPSSLSALVERTQWWTSLFSVPCVACAPTLESVHSLIGTHCEFIAVGDFLFNQPDTLEHMIERVRDKCRMIETSS